MTEKIGDFEYNPDCRYYSGYKPCRFKRLCKGCTDYSPMGKRVLLINLDAMGDVLMTTAMLKPLRRKYGDDAHITWVTRSNAVPLLLWNPLIDRVMEYSPETCMVLANQTFDAVFNCDKSLNACALLNSVTAKEVYGFGLSQYGTIIPVNEENGYNFELGLNDELKFRQNSQAGTQILHQGMGLEFKRDEYILIQTEEEQEFIKAYRDEQGLNGKTVIGINTGCSELYPDKKLSVLQYIELCSRFREAFPDAAVALVGGKAETERNIEISEKAPGVINTPTTLGLRRGIGFVDLCDILITGDTLAMHIGIALKKFVIAFYGISCPQEIDLYERGVKIIPDLECSPCWKRGCDDPKCVTEIDLHEIVQGVKEYK
ncbi:glycosyltransferase family 9 protein [Planctomycetota bacterium]